MRTQRATLRPPAGLCHPHAPALCDRGNRLSLHILVNCFLSFVLLTFSSLSFDGQLNNNSLLWLLRLQRSREVLYSDSSRLVLGLLVSDSTSFLLSARCVFVCSHPSVTPLASCFLAPTSLCPAVETSGKPFT